MIANFIVVNRLTSANGVGNSAVCLYEYLSKKYSKPIVVCMRGDSYYSGLKNIHVFPVKIPYSLETIVLPLFALFYTRKHYIKHSFEVLLAKPSYFHIHFDHKMKKDYGRRNVIKAVTRSIASKVSKIAYEIALRRGAVMVAPSQLLVDRLKLDKISLSSSFHVLPNCLSQNDFTSLISRFAFCDEKSFLSKKNSKQLKNTAAIIANGDFNFKVLNRIDEVLTVIPSEWELLIVGIGKKYKIPTKYQNRIRGIDGISRDDLWNLLESLGAIVIASPFESFSMVALEGIVQGVPIISLGSTGIQEFYDEYVRVTGVKSLFFNQGSQPMFSSKGFLMDSIENQTGFQKFLLSKRQEAFNEMNL